MGSIRFSLEELCLIQSSDACGNNASCVLQYDHISLYHFLKLQPVVQLNSVYHEGPSAYYVTPRGEAGGPASCDMV